MGLCAPSAQYIHHFENNNHNFYSLKYICHGTISSKLSTLNKKILKFSVFFLLCKLCTIWHPLAIYLFSSADNVCRGEHNVLNKSFAMLLALELRLQVFHMLIPILTQHSIKPPLWMAVINSLSVFMSAEI